MWNCSKPPPASPPVRSPHPPLAHALATTLSLSLSSPPRPSSPFYTDPSVPRSRPLPSPTPAPPLLDDATKKLTERERERGSRRFLRFRREQDISVF